MPLIFISGISTAGKSTVAKELSKLGYEAYDTEHDGMSAWFDKSTGKRVAGFNEMPERSKEWLDQHEWLIDPKQVTQLVKDSNANHKFIFLCGGSANESEIRSMCQNSIWLKTDEKTIRNRVSNPRDHDYGTSPHELDRIIMSNAKKELEFQHTGGIIIDARLPVDQVVKDILSFTVEAQ